MKGIWFLLLLLALRGNASAAVPLDPALFAKDGKMERNDVIRFLIQRATPSLDMVQVSNTELYHPAFRKLIGDAATEMAVSGLAKKQSYSVEEIRKAFGLAEPVREPEKTRFTFQSIMAGIHVREKWQDLQMYQFGNEGTDAAPISLARPATFAVNRDFLANNTAWSVHGAVFSSISLQDGALVLVPSATLNKISTSDPAATVDSLVFRGALQYDLSEASWLRGGALYATDTNFRSGQGGVEVEWEYQNAALGIGAFRGIKFMQRRVLYRWQFFLHGEAGGVFDAGNNPNLVQGAPFVRLGPFVQLELKPAVASLKWLDPLVLSARYQGFEALNSGTGSTRLFTAQLSYSFGAEQNFSLNLSYRLGREALTEEKEDNLELSLGLKF